MSEHSGTKVVYFHGGPGLNANPERHVLLPRLQARGLKVALFEEPSAKRPEANAASPGDAFSDYLCAARKFLRDQADSSQVMVVGHSFGAIIATQLCAEAPTIINSLITIGATLDLAEATRRMLRLAAQQSTDASRKQTLLGYAEALQGQFDEHAQRGLMLAAEDTGFMQSYWRDPGVGQAFLQHYVAPRHDLDVDAFMAVRSSFNWNMPTNCNVPVTAIFGATDPLVCSLESSLLLRRAFEHVETIVFEFSGHYPHVEETDRFIDVLFAAHEA